MKNGLDKLYTPKAVDAFIDPICQNMPLGFSERAKTAIAEERARDPKLDALCRALQRKRELEDEKARGIRDEDGFVNVPV